MSATWTARYPLDTQTVDDVREFVAAAGALMAGDWMERQDDGPYAVVSYGEAGVEREHFTGLHYPYQAVELAASLQAASTCREVFLPINRDDPFENVERANEAFGEG